MWVKPAHPPALSSVDCLIFSPRVEGFGVGVQLESSYVDCLRFDPRCLVLTVLYSVPGFSGLGLVFDAAPPWIRETAPPPWDHHRTLGIVVL